MSKLKSASRRQFLGLAGGAAVAGAVPMVTLRPLQATPATLASAIRNVVGAALVRTGRVTLDVPPLVENGNTVPMTVRVSSPMTPEDHVKSIHVFNEKNPQPNIGNFHLGPRAGHVGDIGQISDSHDPVAADGHGGVEIPGGRGPDNAARTNGSAKSIAGAAPWGTLLARGRHRAAGQKIIRRRRG